MRRIKSVILLLAIFSFNKPAFAAGFADDVMAQLLKESIKTVGQQLLEKYKQKYLNTNPQPVIPVPQTTTTTYTPVSTLIPSPDPTTVYTPPVTYDTRTVDSTTIQPTPTTTTTTTTDSTSNDVIIIN